MSSNFDFFNLFQDIDFFDSNIVHLDSKTRQFNEIANFLRNLQHCQFLYRYRKTNLLKFLFNCLNDSAFEWLKKRSHFDFLHIFNIVLTIAFSSQLKARAQKLTKRKVRKIAKRAELKTTEVAKSTSKLQNIDIFDSTACNESEFELYSKVAIFLQHLQQCQHLYRKSDLLNLLSKCLCDFASEWFKTQSEFISLKRFSRTLAKAFSEAFVRRVSRRSNLQLSTLDAISESIENSSTFEITCVRMICKFCKQSFNFNKNLYEHIRSHEVLQSIKNSHLSINAVNLVCEIEKRSFASQKSHESFARSQKSIFESAVAFEAVTLLKRSTLQLLALETTLESTKRLSACRHCKQTFNFKKMLRQHKREQHAKRSVVNSHLLIDAVKSTYESMKISTVNSSSSASLAVQSKQVFEFSTFFELLLFASLDIFNSARSHQNSEKRRFNQIVIFIQHLQQCQHLYDESELLEWMKVILCDFVDIWFENQSNFIFLHDFDIALTKTFFTSIFTHVSFTSFAKSQNSTFESTATFISVITLKRSNLLFFTFESVFIRMKNESLQCSFIQSQNSIQDDLEIDVQKSSIIDSSLTSSTSVTICELVEKSAVTYSSSSQKSSTSSTTSRNLVTDTNVLLQLVSFKNLHLLITTSEITLEYAKNTSDSLIEIAEVAEIFAKSIANIRAQTVRIRARREVECSNLKKQALTFASKSMKRLSFQQTVCVRTICKRCKQNFNFNNKFHEHIRQHHARRTVKDSVLRVSTLEFAYKIVEKSADICSSVSQSASSISFATSRSQIFSAKIVSRSVSSSDSNLTIATFKITSKSMKKLSINCSLTSSLSSSRNSIRKHHEFHMQKSFLIMNDLSRMFNEKSKSFDLRAHQDRSYSSQSFDIRQSSQSCFSIASKKSYLTIENLFEMFDEKFRKKSLFQSQKNVSSREFFSEQSRITIYFKSIVNQKSSISQNSKSSKSKNWNQHMFAKSIRIVFSKDLSERSINLLYKLSDVFCVKYRFLQVLDFSKSKSSKSRTSAETSFFILVLLRLLSIFLLAFAFVSIISAARMNCINVYEQVISIIDRAIQ